MFGYRGRSPAYSILGAMSLLLLIATTLAVSAHPAPPSPEAVEFFEKKVRPVLAEHCYSCHSGGKTAMSGLRLDSLAGMLKGGECGPALVPGQPEKSRLITAIGYRDAKLQMPPTGKLPDDAIAALTEWVQRGAPWPQSAPASPGVPLKPGFNLKARAAHWSFQPIKRPALPRVMDRAWPRSPIDVFILAKLEANGISPAKPADRRTLIRRVTYDLIGLPPTPEEVDAFVRDTSPQAYAKVVDRLLASPHYGERWGRHWLDLVRYAETDGHEYDFDKPGAYQYRDYVIRALNADVPYNQFVREHIAGDLLPHPRLNPAAQFNESILGTGFFFLGEGTHSPVDLRDDEALRVDNQIDVLSKTFLGLSVGCARCHDHKFDPISTKDYYALSGYLHSSRYQLTTVESPNRLRPTLRHLEAIRAQLEACVTAVGAPVGRAKRLPTGPGIVVFADFSGPTWKNWTATGEAFGDGPRPFALAVKQTANGPHLATVGGSGIADSGSLSEKLSGTLRSATFTITRPKIFYHAGGADTEINLIIDGFQRIRAPIYGGLKISIEHPDGLSWYSQDVSKWIGHRAYIELIAHGTGRLMADAILFADHDLPASAQVEAQSAVRKAAAEGGESPAVRRAVIAGLLAQRRALDMRLPNPVWAMAMADGTGENDRVHIRGNAAILGAEVPRRFLEVFNGANQPAPVAGSGRLELAERLVAPSDPLLPRVIVNRLWQHHFGEGIVRTPDDFGLRGEPPTHPEMLDYLASEFVRQGWSLKKLHRIMVLSSTYQMSARSTAEAERLDPTNRLLHRMPVRRLEAEAIRDAILAVSGRLDKTLYGPSVMPYLTLFMEGRGRPETSGPLDGAGRRSIYIAVRRNFLTPMFLAFDYPVPFTTMGRRTVSSVPAQALTLMNDPFVVQQAEVWAKRVLAGPPRTPAQRITGLYLTAFSRPPDAKELAATFAFLHAQDNAYGQANDFRSWRDLCHVLFNVKEFIFLN